MGDIKRYKTQEQIDEEKIEQMLKESVKDDIGKAERELETIELLLDLGVIS